MDAHGDDRPGACLGGVTLGGSTRFGGCIDVVGDPRSIDARTRRFSRNIVFGDTTEYGFRTEGAR